MGFYRYDQWGLLDSFASCENFKRNSKMGKRKALENLIQMARKKFLPKIPLLFLKSLINKLDHILSEVGPTACTKISQKFKQGLEIKLNPYLI